MKALRERGFTVARSAGSHSPVDVWAINPATRQILLVQSKLGKLAKKEEKEINDLIPIYSGMYEVKFELWHS